MSWEMPDWAGYIEFRDRFMEAIDERYFPRDWLDQQVLQREAHFMRTANAAILVELRRFPGGALDLHGLVAAGDMGEILELIPQAEAWGKAQGCTAAVIESRPGWVRATKPLGYQVSQIAVRKDL